MLDAFLQAIQKKDIPKIKEQLTQNPRYANATVSGDVPILRQAVKDQNPALIKLLIEHGAKSSFSYYDVQTHTSISWDMVEHLIKNKDWSLIDSILTIVKQENPIPPRATSLEALLENILRAAVTENKIACVQKILSLGVSPNITTESGAHLLYKALYCERKVMVKDLIKYGADITVRSYSWKLGDLDVFGYLAAYKEWDLLNSLLDMKELQARLARESRSSELQSLLENTLKEAVLVNNFQAAQKILKMDVSANIHTKNGFPLLYEAVKIYLKSPATVNADMIKLLIESGADITIKSIETVGYSDKKRDIIDYLIEFEEWNLIDAIIEIKLVKDMIAQRPRSKALEELLEIILSAAVTNNKIAYVQKMLSLGVSPNIKTKSGHYLLYKAIEHKNEHMVIELIKYEADITVKCDSWKLGDLDVFGYLAACKEWDLLNTLLDMKELQAKLTRESRSSELQSLLENTLKEAVLVNNFQAAQKILKMGVSANIYTKDGFSLLYEAVQIYLKSLKTINADMIKLLIESAADITIKSSEIVGNSIKTRDIIEYLIDFKRWNLINEIIEIELVKDMINQRPRSQTLEVLLENILSAAVTDNKIAYAQKMLSLGVSPNIRTKYGLYLLFEAINNKNEEMVKKLIECGADITVKINIDSWNVGGLNVFEYLAWYKHWGLLDTLLEMKEVQAKLTREPRSKKLQSLLDNTLKKVVLAHNLKTARKLLEMGAPANIRVENETTLLYEAVKIYLQSPSTLNADMITLLIQYGADITIQCTDKVGYPHQNVKRDIVEYLISVQRWSLINTLLNLQVIQESVKSSPSLIFVLAKILENAVNTKKHDIITTILKLKVDFCHPTLQKTINKVLREALLMNSAEEDNLVYTLSAKTLLYRETLKSLITKKYQKIWRCNLSLFLLEAPNVKLQVPADALKAIEVQKALLNSDLGKGVSLAQDGAPLWFFFEDTNEELSSPLMQAVYLQHAELIQRILNTDSPYKLLILKETLKKILGNVPEFKKEIVKLLLCLSEDDQFDLYFQAAVNSQEDLVSLFLELKANDGADFLNRRSYDGRTALEVSIANLDSCLPFFLNSLSVDDLRKIEDDILASFIKKISNPQTRPAAQNLVDYLQTTKQTLKEENNADWHYFFNLTALCHALLADNQETLKYNNYVGLIDLKGIEVGSSIASLISLIEKNSEYKKSLQEKLAEVKLVEYLVAKNFENQSIYFELALIAFMNDQHGVCISYLQQAAKLGENKQIKLLCEKLIGIFVIKGLVKTVDLKTSTQKQLLSVLARGQVFDDIRLSEEEMLSRIKNQSIAEIKDDIEAIRKLLALPLLYQSDKILQSVCDVLQIAPANFCQKITKYGLLESSSSITEQLKSMSLDWWYRQALKVRCAKTLDWFSQVDPTVMSLYLKRDQKLNSLIVFFEKYRPGDLQLAASIADPDLKNVIYGFRAIASFQQYKLSRPSVRSLSLWTEVDRTGEEIDKLAESILQHIRAGEAWSMPLSALNSNPLKMSLMKETGMKLLFAQLLRQDFSFIAGASSMLSPSR